MLLREIGLGFLLHAQVMLRLVALLLVLRLILCLALVLWNYGVMLLLWLIVLVGCRLGVLMSFLGLL